MNNPHDIIKTVLPCEILEKYEIIGRPSKYFLKQSFLIRALKSSFFSLKLLWLVTISPRGKKFFFLEYDKLSLILLLIPVRREVWLNINHNLSTKSGCIISKILSIRYKLILLDGTEEDVKKFPYITTLNTIDFKFQQQNLSKQVVLFAGSRREQKDYNKTEIDFFVKRLQRANWDVTVCGKNYNGVFLDPCDLAKLTPVSHVIILFGDNYVNRNSGTVWNTGRVAGTIWIKSKNKVFINQLCRSRIVRTYSNLEDITLGHA